jgi:alkyldihydroxyacetonephosphate synthase
MRWWGWGEDSGAIDLPASALAALAGELGFEPAADSAPVALEDVALPEPALSAGARSALEQAVGRDNVRDDRESRVLHANGKSYPDLVRLRSGDGSGAPDAVVFPGSADEVAAVLDASGRAGVAVVPFGGGSSVVGGVEALRGGHSAAISLGLARMDRVLDVDRRSLTVRLEPGLFGPDLERKLGGAGLTLGHFPQSFEYSTVGGWVATRSAGQASTGYGRIDELVEAVALTAPAGTLTTLDVPATAAGPSLRELVVGSEGVLGVVSAATLRVRPAPAVRHYEGWSFKTFEEGYEALRLLAQADAWPDVARLSDAEETRLSMTLSATGSRSEQLGRSYLRLRGHEGGCLAFTGFDGAAGDVSRRRRHTAGILRAAGALSLGQRPGKSWLRNRFAAPYLRDDMLGRGVMVETLETATTWTSLPRLYEAVAGTLRDTLAGRGTPPLVMCHVSHVYRAGASLYFTFIARQEQGAEIDQWRAVKGAACDAIVANGGTISHHHAVGADHAPWMPAEVGELGLDLLRAAKERLDPAGIMNPEKLIPGA